MTKNKIDEAIQIIKSLGLPREQHNERSGLCLLALLNLTPEKSWKDAEAPLIGITPIMDFIALHYGKKYAPNTRETVRRQTMHQFVEAGIALYNPDEPSRPVNSPKAVYQIEPSALALMKLFGSKKWRNHLKKYLSSQKTLAERYAKEREQVKLPVLTRVAPFPLLLPRAQKISTPVVTFPRRTALIWQTPTGQTNRLSPAYKAAARRGKTR